MPEQEMFQNKKQGRSKTTPAYILILYMESLSLLRGHHVHTRHSILLLLLCHLLLNLLTSIRQRRHGRNVQSDVVSGCTACVTHSRCTISAVGVIRIRISAVCRHHCIVVAVSSASIVVINNRISCKPTHFLYANP